MPNKRLCLGVVLAAAGAVVLPAQEQQPLSIRGTFSTGYYGTSSRGEENQSLQFVPFGAKLDLNGYLKTPDLMTYYLRPELNLGPQASEAGFQGGNGIQLGVTFFRRLLPLTFRYSNLQAEDVYFGGLTQLSGYTLKNRNKDLGLTLEFKHEKLPDVTVDWGLNSVDSTSATAGIPDYQSHGNHVNLDSAYERGNWVFHGFVRRQVQDSDLLEPVAGGATGSGTFQQTVLQYQGGARRGFLGDSEFFVDAGRQSTSSLLYTLPLDIATTYASANLRLFQKRKWRGSLRAGYSSNLASQLLAQAGSSLAAANSVAPDQNIFEPFSHGMSSYTLTANTTGTLPHGFGLYASLERNAILSTRQEKLIGANYFTTSGGITYSHKLHWGSVSGEYGREFGLGSITGDTGRIQGQNFRAGVLRTTSSNLQVMGSVHGTEQSVHNSQPIANRALAFDGSVSDHLLGQFSGRVGGGWQWSRLENSGNAFRTNGYTALAGIDHPRFQIAATLNNSLSNSLPFYNDVVAAAGMATPIIVPLRTIPSDYRSMSYSLHTIPLRKLEFSAVWTRSRQHLDGILNNDLESLAASAIYHFRKIELEAGYIRFNQVFAFYPDTMRTRFFIRVVRSAKLL
jgi:hypothetical protein